LRGIPARVERHVGLREGGGEDFLALVEDGFEARLAGGGAGGADAVVGCLQVRIAGAAGVKVSAPQQSGLFHQEGAVHQRPGDVRIGGVEAGDHHHSAAVWREELHLEEGVGQGSCQRRVRQGQPRQFTVHGGFVASQLMWQALDAGFLEVRGWRDFQGDAEAEHQQPAVVADRLAQGVAFEPALPLEMAVYRVAQGVVELPTGDLERLGAFEQQDAVGGDAALFSVVAGESGGGGELLVGDDEHPVGPSVSPADARDGGQQQNQNVEGAKHVRLIQASTIRPS